jgi:LmbE family N-acetylglucosaminyl deacetylase
MKTAMMISPHADDAAAFCGATLAKFTDDGWNMILVRVTDDRKDSVKLSIEETIRKNAEELRKAADILGIKEIIELGFETDMLADIPLGKIRERIVYLFRKYQPYAVFTFDPDGLYENNQDHVRVAQAVDEAFWVSSINITPNISRRVWNHSRSVSVGILPASFPKRIITKKSRKPSRGRSWRSVRTVR